MLETQKAIESYYMEENNTCVCCGTVIPEGRQVCVSCEIGNEDDSD